MAQRIKVNVSDLIERIETKKAEHLAAVAQKQAAYDKERKRYQAALVKSLKALLAKAEAGEACRSRYGGVEVKVGVNFPEKPSATTESFDRDLNLLRMSAADTITVSVEDRQWSRYL